MQRARSCSLFAAVLILLASAAPASAGTLEQIRDAGQIRLGYVDGARPFSYRDESGNPAGYSVALCQRVADTLKTDLALPGLRSEFVLLTADERFEAVKQGKVDLLCAAGAPTASRRRQASFSVPVFLGGVSALIHDDAPARMREMLEGQPAPYEPRWRASLGQVLRGRVFVAARGTTAVDWLEAKVGELGIEAEVQTVDSFDSGVERVAKGGADAFFAERALLLDAAKRSASAGELVLLERRFTYEAVALALPRGDEDFRLQVDRTLSRLYRSGEIEAIYTPYFGKPDPLVLRFFQASSLAD